MDPWLPSALLLVVPIAMGVGIFFLVIALALYFLAQWPWTVIGVAIVVLLITLIVRRLLHD